MGARQGMGNKETSRWVRPDDHSSPAGTRAPLQTVFGDRSSYSYFKPFINKVGK